MRKTKWEIQEAGWYISALGHIWMFEDGWWFFPPRTITSQRPPEGPFKTFKEAKAEAERSLT